MWVDAEVIQAAAQLIVAGLDDLPRADTAEWHGFGDEDAATLVALVDELTWADLCLALRSAAQRLPEPVADNGEDD